MTTTTLSSKSRFRSLLKGMLRRNRALAIYLFVAIFFFFPLQYILEIQRQLEDLSRYGSASNWLYGPSQVYTSISLIAMVFILTTAPLVLTLAQVSYLHNHRSVDLYHSLPLTRTQLLGANTLAVFLTIAIPYLLNYLLVVIAGIVRMVLGGGEFVLSPGQILLDILGWLTVELVIIALVMLVATQVGSVFENFVFTCELVMAPVAVLGISIITMNTFLVGFSDRIPTEVYAAINPIGMMIGRIAESQSSVVNGKTVYQLAAYNWMLVGWMLAAAVLLAAADRQYRRRRSGTPATPRCHGPLGVASSAVAVFVGGAGFGGLLYLVVSEYSEQAFVIGVVIGSILTFLLVEAVLNRGFKGLWSKMPRGAALTALTMVLALIVVTGGLGYETRMPAVDQVQSVTINYRGRRGEVILRDASSIRTSQSHDGSVYYNYDYLSDVTLTTPEGIDLVQQIHQARLKANIRPSEEGYYYFDGPSSFHYQLDRGNMYRSYRCASTAELPLLHQLEALPEFREQTDPALLLTADQVQNFQVSGSWGFHVSGSLTNRQLIEDVVEALHQDVLSEDTTRLDRGEAEVVGFLYFDTSYDDRVPLTADHLASFSYPILDSYTQVLAVLERAGLSENLETVEVSQLSGVGMSMWSPFSAQSETKVYQFAEIDPHYSSQTGDMEEMFLDEEMMTLLMDSAVAYRLHDGSSNNVVYITPFLDGQAGVTLMLDLQRISPELASILEPKLEPYGLDLSLTTDQYLTFRF
ncbi:hypothetical protein [Angelakisella massiliensis]|uniref:hypothetical protein n=1 Tax=Angelakisella massiliensis TaxID=1871018 RepID=UPI0024B1AFB3|nr:hypothetical protein [Angelakisella massiliensis]